VSHTVRIATLDLAFARPMAKFMTENVPFQPAVFPQNQMAEFRKLFLQVRLTP